MSLYFRNSTKSTVQVAIFYHASRCGFVFVGQTGILSTWYRLAPGQTREVVTGNVGDRTIYYYAESISRNLVWSGSFPIHVPNYSFNGCWIWNINGNLCNNCRRVGFKTLNIQRGFVNFTVNLITNSAQRKTKLKNVRMVLPTKRVKRKSKLNDRKKLPRSQ
ncbi:DUF1036 domain-containing protein [Paenibacillus peoriae]|uniref:DUF1036 domain-containing protein n=1 Tax=Paenibacillus peoriae TaxID=59893 RepID=UPI003D7B8624